MNQKKRIEWVDVAKGISIILVVLGHTRLSDVPYLGDWLGAFRMPFFFFVSGLLFNPEKNTDFRPFIKKKYKGLIRPFIIFSIMVMIGYALVSEQEISHRLSRFPKAGWEGYALWFIPVLLLTNILYFFLCRTLSSIKYRILGIILFAAIGFLSYITDIPNYWNLNFSLTAVFFYGIGNLIAPVLNNILNKPSPVILFFSLLCAVISFGFIINVKPSFYVNHLGYPGVTHVVGIAGALMMCSFSALFVRLQHPIVKWTTSSMKYFGRNSYVVLAFHQIIITLFAAMLPSLPSSLVHICMWLILILLIELISRKCPYILGRERKTSLAKSELCISNIKK